ncbi:unnamed protein product [Rotaria sp. Silwood2]|nr:unnamed protein product [Rotaria sp. Silwood2]CAF4507854.1 unnamed protein product [Rotaria sp. Silwood2]
MNSLSAALDQRLARSTHYITCPNCSQLNNKLKMKEQFQNLFSMLVYMSDVYHYQLWLATWNNGLCTSTCSACQVTALVGRDNPTSVTIVEQNEYPFDDTIYFRFQLPIPTQFNVYLRIPQWCQESIELYINGEIIFNKKPSTNDSYLVPDRIWCDGDLLMFKIPMTVQMKIWLKKHNSVSILYGLLSFCVEYL